MNRSRAKPPDGCESSLLIDGDNERRAHQISRKLPRSAHCHDSASDYRSSRRHVVDSGGIEVLLPYRLSTDVHRHNTTSHRLSVAATTAPTQPATRTARRHCSRTMVSPSRTANIVRRPLSARGLSGLRTLHFNKAEEI